MPGSRPYCVLTPWASPVDYPAIERSLQHALAHLVPPTSHTAVLCSEDISPRQVAAAIPTAILYDGGVEEYDGYGDPTLLASSERCDQRPGLERWLTTGGTLVTHERLFRGMEAASVLYVTRNPGLVGGVRSALMRAVASLVLVSDSRLVKEEKVGEAFEVVNI